MAPLVLRRGLAVAAFVVGGLAGLVHVFVLEGEGATVHIYLPVLFALLRLREPPVERLHTRLSLRTLLSGGFQAARESPLLRAALWLTILFNLFAWPVLSMVPVIGREQLRLDPQGVGVLASLDGVGSLIGALVLSTAACWGAGIVLTNADYAFTVTNVLIHGIPYLGLTLLYGRVRGAQIPRSLLGRIMRAGVPVALLLLLGLAFAEEWLWDRYVWQERAWLFGEGSGASPSALVWLVPLLSLPQTTHYALDGLVWRKQGNPDLGGLLVGTPASAAPR